MAKKVRYFETSCDVLDIDYVELSDGWHLVTEGDIHNDVEDIKAPDSKKIKYGTLSSYVCDYGDRAGEIILYLDK